MPTERSPHGSTLPHHRFVVPTLLVLASAAAAQAQPSFDCAKAGTPVDKLICADSTLAAPDRELAARYEKLRGELSPDSFATVRQSQIAWLKRARADCAPGRKTEDGPLSREDAASCLVDQYGDRNAALDSPIRAIGKLTLEFRLRYRTTSDPDLIESDAYPWLTGEPTATAAAFNHYVARNFNLTKGLFEAAGIKLEPDVPGGSIYRRFYELYHTDVRLISLEVFEYHEANFGHAWRAERALNWDLMHGRPLTLGDIFVSDSKWQDAVTTFVHANLRSSDDVQNPDSLIDVADLTDTESWLFDDSNAILLLGRGERSLAGESADVKLPYEVLQPFLRRDATLPGLTAPNH